MSGQSCPLPSRDDDSDAAIIQRLLRAERIAVVGLSDNPARASYAVAKYLLSVGKEIIPVNPTHASVLGRPCFPSLEAISGAVDLVDVFRRPEFCPDLVRSAIKIGAGGVWLQSGIVSTESRRLAREANLPYVEDRCLMVEHLRTKL